jgi:hypothetical protein
LCTICSTDDDENTTTETYVAVKLQSSVKADKCTSSSSSDQQHSVAETSVAATIEPLPLATDSQQSQHSDVSSPVTESSGTVSSGSVDDIASADLGGEIMEPDAAAASVYQIEPTDSAKSTDRESVVSSHSSEPSGWSAVSSDVAKSDSLVVVSATPDRTTPSDEGSSNAKGT